MSRFNVINETIAQQLKPVNRQSHIHIAPIQSCIKVESKLQCKVAMEIAQIWSCTSVNGVLISSLPSSPP